MKVEDKHEKIEKIVKMIEDSEKIVFFHHVQPDGDSLACSYATLKIIQKNFPDKTIKWVANVEHIKKFFSYLNIDFSDVISGDEVDHSWTAIIGDTSTFARIYGNNVYAKAGKKICFDHHDNVIDFKVDILWRESTYVAATLMAYEILERLNVRYTSWLACLLMFGIITDSDFFQYSLNQPMPLIYASELVIRMQEQDLQKLYRGYLNRDKNSIDIQEYALGHYVLDHKVLYITWTDEIQKKLDSPPDKFANPGLIKNMLDSEIWIAFTEYKKAGFIRCEFRSYGAPVDQLAKEFGGGGHRRAAGAKVKSLDMIPKIVEAAKKLLEEYNKNKNNPKDGEKC